MLSGRERGECDLDVQREGGEVEHGIDVLCGHGFLVRGRPPRYPESFGDVATALRSARARHGQLDPICEPTELREVVSLGDVADPDYCQAQRHDAAESP